MNGMNSQMLGLCLSSSPLLLALVASLACGSRVIGQADSNGGIASGGSSSSETATGGGSSGCPDDLKRQWDDEWRSGTNMLEELAGASFEGYVRPGQDLNDGADIALLFRESGDVSLIVGDAAPPAIDANKGYLCEWEDGHCLGAPLKPGGTYPIYDTRVADDRVRFTLNRNGAFDGWCALQTPYSESECSHHPRRSAGFEGAPIERGASTPCTIGEEVVDCDWFFLLNESVCYCDSESCFPARRNLPFDATYNPAERTLTGILGDYQVYLKRLDTSCSEAGEGGAGGECND